MKRFALPLWGSLSVALVILAVSDLPGLPSDALAGPPLYWCPQRPSDQQYGAEREPGCVPLVEKEKADSKAKRDKAAALPPIKLENIQTEASAFLNDYRQYLACCGTDPDTLEDLEELDGRASAILKAAETGLFTEKMKLKGFTLSEVIPPVARARDQLREIEKRLVGIAAAKDRLHELDYETAGREQRRIQELEDSIARDFGIKPSPPSPKSGMEIGQTPPTGPSIGNVPPTGPEFGMQGRTGRDLGYTPATGRDIGQTPPTGFEIGRTGAAGPAIGESDLNARPSGTTSTLGGSSVDSSMQNRPLGSGLSPSMVESDLQSRPGPPPPDVPLSSVGSSLKGRTP
jgi:hypothetical protein